MAPKYFTHPEPAWRERADLILMARLADEAEPPRFEQLWARRVSETECELCCIPLFVYGASLGDIVEYLAAPPHDFEMRRVTRRSGRATFRVWFGETHADQGALMRRVAELGADAERGGPHLVAVAIPGAVANQMFAFLEEQERAGQLTFENGDGRGGPPQ